jgi:DNA helicase HerA-like ATPase
VGSPGTQLFVLIDEAHNLVPAEAGTELQQVSLELLNTIAAEGRKFGLNLILVTQRPSKIHPNCFGMLSNLVCMKVTNREDVDTLRRAFSHVPSALFDEVPFLPQGAALLSGKSAPFPCLVQFGSRLTAEGIKEP